MIIIEGYLKTEARNIARKIADHDIVKILANREPCKILAVIGTRGIRKVGAHFSALCRISEVDIKPYRTDARVYPREFELCISLAEGYRAVVVVGNVRPVRAGKIELLLLISAEKSVYRRKIHHAQVD